MALEFQADFDGYIDSSYGHGVSGIFLEAQSILWDARNGLIDTWYDIDSGDSRYINLIFDADYFSIPGESVDFEGYQPTAYIKYKDAPYVSHDDKLVINAITTRSGTSLFPETIYAIKGVENTNNGFVKVALEEQ
jgi:hypothetical protein